MLLIAGTVRVQPEDREAAIAILTEMIAHSVVEDGCASYAFSADFTQPELFHLFEEWESQEHLDAHFATEHFSIYREGMGNLGALERRVFKYEATGKTQL